MRSSYLMFFLACVLIIGCQEAPSTSGLADEAAGLEASKGGGQQSVTGHVEVPVIGITEKYSFSASRQPNGTVKGEWQVKDKFGPGANFKVHGDVTCFTIAPDGKTAWLGGIMEQNNFGIPPGSEAIWTVVDNGQGQDPPDLATDLTFGFPPGSGVAAFHCATGAGPTNIPPTPTTGGNVQVQP